jgi:glycosyltransferase involved in cell wall biosynthesis
MPSRPPKISVITVCYNSAATIVDTLRSVNAQTYADVEHIVVDGGSTDETLAIVRAEGARVTTLVSEPDRGIYDAMNKGLRLATGDVIGFINSDDFLASPDVFAKIALAFADPEVGAVYGDLCYVRKANPAQVVRHWRSSPFKPGLFARGWAPPHPTFYVRRELYERFGGYELAYPLASDHELMARFLEVHHVHSLYVPELFVRMRTGGATNRSLANIAQQNREIWRAMRKHGLAGSMVGFALRKLVSRGRQFLLRPDA